MNDVIQKFTQHLKDVFTRALCLAVEQKEIEVRPIHLLWALSTQSGCMASEILEKSGVKKEALQTMVGVVLTDIRPPEATSMPALSLESKSAIEQAVMIAHSFEHRFVGTEHLLSGLLQIQSKEITALLSDLKTDTALLSRHIGIVLKTTSLFSRIATGPNEDTITPHLTDETEEEASEHPALEAFCDELTDPKTAASFHPVVGREPEIARLTQILLRRTKNNPMLVGEPGVGKTAIVEGLAKRIVEKQVPRALQDKRIFRLDLAGLIAGTMYRGEFESRLRELIEEVGEHPEIILFIDEVHAMMGAGSASGSLDAAHMLKPALARGELRCIGATTKSEYKKFIENDGALERRFHYVHVEEPSREETEKILCGVLPYYEKFHCVSYPKETLGQILDVSSRYFSHKQFPDKAIDLLDEAGALVAIRGKKSNVLPSDILTITSQMTHIPVERLIAKNTTTLARLPRLLAQSIFGQDAVLNIISKSIQKAFLGLGRTPGPLASFLFMGPSGVGKTELAKTLATTLFNNPGSFLRLDMSEYAERHTVSKLLGAPAGYVGYRESTPLADQLKTHPHSIILFDEIEKAHEDVHRLLLQILDTGTLTDATGEHVDFSHAMIVLTSNIGNTHFDGASLGFAESDATDGTLRASQTKKLLEEKLSRELVGRIGTIALFLPLTRSSLEAIAKKELRAIATRLGLHRVQTIIAPSITKAIIKKAPAHANARDVIHLVEKEIEHLVLERLMQGTKSMPRRMTIAQKKDGSFYVR